MGAECAHLEGLAAGWAAQDPRPPDRVPALLVRRYQHGCWIVIEADGEWDIEAFPQVRGLLAGDLSHLVFDLRRVTFIDASGLGVLAASRRNLGGAHGSVRVTGPSRQVRKLLAITALDQAVPVFASFDEAFSGHRECRASPVPAEVR